MAFPLFFLGAAAVAGLRVFFVPATTPLRLFALLCAVTFAAELLGHYMRQSGAFSDGNETNHWFYNIFNAFQIFILCKIFYLKLHSDNLRVVIQFFYVVFLLFIIANTLAIQGFVAYQTLTVVVGGGFVIFLAGAYFWQLLVSPDNERITRDPFFWFSFGLIVYFGGSIPFLGMLNYLIQYYSEFTKIYFTLIYTGFSVVFNIMITIGFLCRKDYLKSYSF